MPAPNAIPNITRHISLPDETWTFIDRQANEAKLNRSAYIKKIFDDEMKREKENETKNSDISQ